MRQRRRHTWWRLALTWWKPTHPLLLLILLSHICLHCPHCHCHSLHHTTCKRTSQLAQSVRCLETARSILRTSLARMDPRSVDVLLVYKRKRMFGHKNFIALFYCRYSHRSVVDVSIDYCTYPIYRCTLQNTHWPLVVYTQSMCPPLSHVIMYGHLLRGLQYENTRQQEKDVYEDLTYSWGRPKDYPAFQMTIQLTVIAVPLWCWIVVWGVINSAPFLAPI